MNRREREEDKESPEPADVSDHVCPLCAQSHVHTVIGLTKSALSWYQDEDAALQQLCRIILCTAVLCTVNCVSLICMWHSLAVCVSLFQAHTFWLTFYSLITGFVRACVRVHVRVLSGSSLTVSPGTDVAASGAAIVKAKSIKSPCFISCERRTNGLGQKIDTNHESREESLISCNIIFLNF